MVLLVSMPWPYYTMPSVQISSLKAYLLANGVKAICSHLHLEIAHWLGFNNYNDLTKDFLEDGESLYAYMLFPQMREKVLSSEYLLRKGLKVSVGKKVLQIPSEDFFEQFDDFHTEHLKQFNWEEIEIVGFTLNFGQTAASLYLANKIKQLYPNIKVIIGGAEASGKLGLSILENFPFIDYVCNGEGEKPLLDLAKQIKHPQKEKIKGINSQEDLISSTSSISFYQLENLSSLPCPDFDEYFQVIEKKLNGNFSICTSLPIESSRGCYFNCSFCALNLQWDNFRVIPKENVVRNISFLSKKHQTLEFFFVDNITPTKVTQLCEEIVRLQLPLSCFYETRANLPKSHFKALKDAGVNKVQLGIEAFSTSLLKKFDKKTTALHNLQGLKNCYEYDITVVGNLISEYPFSEPSDIEDTIKNIELAISYPPSLSFSTFALEVGSPDFKKAEEKGIIIEGNYGLYKRIYPEKLLETFFLPRKKYSIQKKVDTDWEIVQTSLDKWSDSYHFIKYKYGYGTKPLTYKDGKDFIIIEDFRYKRRDLYKYPTTLERDVYITADQVISREKLYELLKNYRPNEIDEVIEEFIINKLMASEENYVLSLAIPAN